MLKSDIEQARDTLIVSTQQGNSFASSLLNQLDIKGFLSESQMSYVLGAKDAFGKRTKKNPKGYPSMQESLGLAPKPTAKTEFVDGKPMNLPTNEEDEKPRLMLDDGLSSLNIETADKKPIDFSKFVVPLRILDYPPNAKPDTCIKTEEFKHLPMPFKWFNPMQSTFLPYIEKDENIVITAQTSAGKTLVLEMVAAYTLSEIRKTDPKATIAYISPLKALCKEKYDDWTSKAHPFSLCNISVLTGDYILTDARKKELASADLICMSSEMLGSRIRRNQTEKNYFLSTVKNLINDESHIIGMKERGHNNEVAIAKFAKLNPNCRIIFLSATMPNVKELADWLTSLNGKPTTVLESDYRPVKLNTNFEQYNDNASYHQAENNKIQAAIDVVKRHEKDKFIVFVHAKKTGRNMLEKMREENISTEFHCADLTREDREHIEKEFRSKDPKSLRALISTSTLAYGINQPARRVIITGIRRGTNLVESRDITQEAGRCGRYGIDEFGDVHYVLGTKNFIEDKKHCFKVEPVKSQIDNVDVLGFHLVSEIEEGSVSNLKEGVDWTKTTLAYKQHIFGNDEQCQTIVKATIEKLIECNAIKDHEGKLKTTPIGKVSSWYYYSPFDVSYWAGNFNTLLKNPTISNEEIAWALANRHTTFSDYPIRGILLKKVALALEDRQLRYPDGVAKHIMAIYCMLSNIEEINPDLITLMSYYRGDLDRIMSAIIMLRKIGNYFKGNPGEDCLYEVPDRLRYGVPPALIELVQLPMVGKVRARDLYEGRRICDCQAFVGACNMGKPPFKEDLIQKMLPTAQEIAAIGKRSYLRKKYKIY
jgi:replicative superfamily II helicase